VALRSCTPDGRHGWVLRTATEADPDNTNAPTGYAEERDGVLVVVSQDGNRPHDDLRAIARSAHPLDDHALWRYLDGVPWWLWPAM
jgi:hypothetical protein